VKFFKILTIFILFSANLSANEKDQIVTQLNNLTSLEFTFDQIINNKTEKGNCFLEFPGKLKCNYFDDKKKS
jgi:outer membrane lipoprotein-sorting protein